MKQRDFREQAGYLGLEQGLPADAAVDFFFLADLRPILQHMGNRGYRAVQLEAGILDGKLYLAAYAQRLGATGLTFYGGSGKVPIKGQGSQTSPAAAERTRHGPPPSNRPPYSLTKLGERYTSCEADSRYRTVKVPNLSQQIRNRAWPNRNDHKPGLRDRALQIQLDGDPIQPLQSPELVGMAIVNQNRPGISGQVQSREQCR